MTPTDPNSFDDPTLKAAICRVWGGECAPGILRDRIHAIGIGSAGAPAADITPSASAAQRRIGGVLRHPRVFYAMAACVTMLIGFSLAYRLDQPPAWRMPIDSPTSVSLPLPGLLPASVAQDIVDVHARCQEDPDHRSHQDIARDDFAALRQRLGRELGFPVLLAPLDAGGAPGNHRNTDTNNIDQRPWEFRGGAICPIDRRPAAHSVFVRNGQAVSIFSLPRSACPDARGGEEVEDPNPSRPLTVFVRPDGVHCVIGTSPDGSLSPEQLRVICQRLRPYLDR